MLYYYKLIKRLSFILFIAAFALQSCILNPSNSIDVDINGSRGDQTVPPKIPVKDFFKTPERLSYRLSPNGEYWAFLAPYKNRKNIFVQRIGSEEALQVTKIVDRDLNAFFWLDDESLIYIRDFNGDENFHLFRVSKDGKTEVDLTPFDGVMVKILDVLEDDPDHILVLMNKRNPKIFDVHQLNVRTQELKLVAENPGNITSWVTDHDGNVRLAGRTDGVNAALLYRETPEQPFREILTTNFKETVDPLYFDFENEHHAYALSNRGRDKSAIIKLDLRTGEELETIFEHSEVDVRYMSYSKKRKVPTTIMYVTWKRMFHFLDEETKALYERLGKDLGDYEQVIVSADKEEQRFIIRTYSDRSMGAFYFYDLKTDQLEHISDVVSWDKEEHFAKMKPIQYSSRDGLTIHGYLTLPVGRLHQNLPVVVMPHGGPWARDVWTFDPTVQFLANRGYAVLQMNFRGSVGYGRKFWEASFKEWGLKMQDDVTDGVRWLINEGIADSTRIAIYGASYGGYSTLAGVTFTPDLYACAIDYVGVSNLFTFLESVPPYWEPYREMLYEMVGNPAIATDSLRMRATSPVFHVEKIKAPLFIVQGAKDPRVKQAESDQMVDALRKRGVQVEYLLKENEGHGFRNEENRMELYTKVDAFLAKHLQ